MNAITPMIIPSSVRNDRSLCAQIADNASLNVSVKFIVLAKSLQLLYPNRSDRALPLIGITVKLT
jgi:hypothetical protein